MGRCKNCYCDRFETDFWQDVADVVLMEFQSDHHQMIKNVNVDIITAVTIKNF